MTRTTFKKTAAAVMIALGLGAAGASAALAEQHTGTGDRAEVEAFLASPMTIADAITAAEAETGGTAMSVEFDAEDTEPARYEVEVAMADGATTTVAVNPADDGTVTAIADEDDDEDDDDDETEDDDGDSN